MNSQRRKSDRKQESHVLREGYIYRRLCVEGRLSNKNERQDPTDSALR